MSVDLQLAAGDYLRDRRARGYVLADEDWLLAAFLDGLAARGQATITIAARSRSRPSTRTRPAAGRPASCAPIRGLAAHVHALDPAAAELIPAGLIPSKTPRRIPYLYSEQQIVALMDRALTLSPPMLGASMHTLIGLLATTGMRSGEAAALDVEDLDTERERAARERQEPPGAPAPAAPHDRPSAARLPANPLEARAADRAAADRRARAAG